MERIESLKVFIVTSHKLRGKIEQGGFTKNPALVKNKIGTISG
jgi:hypothetical protein